MGVPDLTRRATGAPNGDTADARGLGGYVDGRLEVIRDGHARGWAWTPGEPEARLALVVLVDDRPVASGVAGLDWPRLKAAGIGDGQHGFEIALPDSLADGWSHSIQVVAGPCRDALDADRDFSVDAAPYSTFDGTSFVARRRSSEVSQPGGRSLAPRPGAAVVSAGVRESWRSWLVSRSDVLPFWLLGAACFAYVLLAAYLTRHFNFFQDDYQILEQRRPWNADALLAPQNQHLMLTLMLFYKVLFVTVGLGTFWPYQLPVFGAHVACVLALYILASHRVGRWVALVPAGLMLVLFPGYEIELWSINVCIAGALAAGLWALICLERADRKRDVWACVLLLLSISTHSVGLFLALGIGVGIALKNWRRLWVVAVPLALYALWYLHYGQSDVVWGNLPHVPGYDVHIAGYGFGSLLGLSSSSFGTKALYVGYLLMGLTVTWLSVQAFRRRLDPLSAVGVVAAVGFWTATALARGAFGEPDASRYLYTSAAFILLALIGSLPRWHVRPQVFLPVAAVGLAIVAAVGFKPLRGYASDRTTIDAVVRVELGAIQLAGAAAQPNYIVDEHYMGGITASDWLSIVHDLGSNAFTATKIEQMPESYREAADRTLIGSEAIQSHGVTSVSCSQSVDIQSAADAVSLAPGTIVYVTSKIDAPLGIGLRRLGQTFTPKPQWTVPARHSVRITLPRDASTLQWSMRLGTKGVTAADGPVAAVCSASL